MVKKNWLNACSFKYNFYGSNFLALPRLSDINPGNRVNFVETLYTVSLI